LLFVKNAIKFTNSGFIEIGYERKGKILEFFVKDTGVGIRQDKWEKLNISGLKIVIAE